MKNNEQENQHISLSVSDIEHFCTVTKALASPIRVGIVSLLKKKPMNVNELADALGLPVSTTALNVRQLEDAGVIRTEIQPGIRGAMKLCFHRLDSVSLCLVPDDADQGAAVVLSLPLGSYAQASGIAGNCGLASKQTFIGEKNTLRSFYLPERAKAQVVFLDSGALEYRFSLGSVDPSSLQWLEISMELASNASAEDGSFSLMLNDRFLGRHHMTDGFCNRRGRLNPMWWSDTAAQFGAIRRWRIDSQGTSMDGVIVSSTTLSDLALAECDYLTLRIEAQRAGLYLFGEEFGDYAQDIVVQAGC